MSVHVSGSDRQPCSWGAPQWGPPLCISWVMSLPGYVVENRERLIWWGRQSSRGQMKEQRVCLLVEVHTVKASHTLLSSLFHSTCPLYLFNNSCNLALLHGKHQSESQSLLLECCLKMFQNIFLILSRNKRWIRVHAEMYWGKILQLDSGF